jgi:hypothetical protein
LSETRQEERMMASKPDTGPDQDERDNPGSSQPNPAGVSTEQPAEGSEGADPKQPGSPQG